MPGYRRDTDWGEAISAQAANWMMVVVLAAVAVAIIIFIATLKEVPRIYAERGFQPTGTARVLWIALATLLGLWLLAAVLALNPATVVLATYVASWSFLAFVMVVEGCDQYARRLDPPKAPPEELTIDDVLTPFQFPGASPSGNGSDRELASLLRR